MQTAARGKHARSRVTLAFGNDRAGRTGPYFVLIVHDIHRASNASLRARLSLMTPDLPAVEIAIIAKTNLFRRAHKLGELRRDTKLDQAAKAFARYLAESGKFSHTADGRQPAERIKAAGYKYCRIAENLALNGDPRGFRARQLAEQAVTGWKNSPGHRRNMLLADVTEIGVGVAKASSEHRYLSVQLFGRPEKLKYTFKITNRAGRTVTYSFAGKAQSIPARAVLTYTACAPGMLRFPSARVRGAAVNAKAEFPTKAGDAFVVRMTGGRLSVSHRPRID